VSAGEEPGDDPIALELADEAAPSPKAKAKAKNKRSASDDPGEPEAPANQECSEHDEGQGDEEAPAAGAEVVESPEGKATFARRYKPAKDLAACRRWISMRDTYNLKVAPKLVRPLALEDAFWKHCMEDLKGNRGDDPRAIQKIVDKATVSFLALEL
ncbi:unnamed protein product, partial [Symbiodinium pilosum]